MNIENFISEFKSQLEDESIEVTPQTNYVNAKFWDSLTNMVVVVMLEDNYKINVSSKELNKFSSVQELFDFVKSQQK
jgi:acyl carrier protein